jgi:hypothetical protein
MLPWIENLITMLSLVLLLLCLQSAQAFVPIVARPRLSCTPLESILGGSDSDNKSNLLGFNPFNYSRQSASRETFSTNRISLRQTRLQELTQKLLAVFESTKHDNTAVQALLKDYQDVLLEPLLDDQAVLDPDSVYKPSMTRADRFAVYRTTMQDRIDKAKNGSVRRVLVAMRDFVLSHEKV